MYTLGIDFSRTFRIIGCHVTSNSVRFYYISTLSSNHGTRQGDSLFTPLFVFCLKLYSEICVKVSMDQCVNSKLLSLAMVWLWFTMALLAFSVFFLLRNVYLVHGHNPCEQNWLDGHCSSTKCSYWTLALCRELESLLGDSQDVHHPKLGALVASHGFWRRWIHAHILWENSRFRLDNVNVLRILLYCFVI